MSKSNCPWQNQSVGNLSPPAMLPADKINIVFEEWSVRILRLRIGRHDRKVNVLPVTFKRLSSPRSPAGKSTAGNYAASIQSWRQPVIHRVAFRGKGRIPWPPPSPLHSWTLFSTTLSSASTPYAPECNSLPRGVSAIFRLLGVRKAAHQLFFRSRKTDGSLPIASRCSRFPASVTLAGSAIAATRFK